MRSHDRQPDSTATRPPRRRGSPATTTVVEADPLRRLLRSAIRHAEDADVRAWLEGMLNRGGCAEG